MYRALVLVQNQKEVKWNNEFRKGKLLTTAELSRRVGTHYYGTASARVFRAVVLYHINIPVVEFPARPSSRVRHVTESNPRTEISRLCVVKYIIPWYFCLVCRSAAAQNFRAGPLLRCYVPKMGPLPPRNRRTKGTCSGRSPKR